jgi:hypothetical protein
MGRLRSVRRIVLVLACGVILNTVALVALAATPVGISGREFFPGVHYGSATYGASFAGATTAGGGWAASINYLGTAGLGRTVTIFGGSWVIANADGSRLFGRVSTGTVAWPANLSSSITGSGCGNGVAAFSAALSNGGSIAGCLDDTHFATVFPPTIVGFLTLP